MTFIFRYVEQDEVVSMEEIVFSITQIAICCLAMALNLAASIVLFKRKPLRPFQMVLLNIVLLHIVYALNDMSSYLVKIVRPDLTQKGIFKDKSFREFIILKSSMVVHAICLFIVFMTIQRFIAVSKPLKYTMYVNKHYTVRGSLIIYCVVIVLFTVCSLIIWKTNANGRIIGFSFHLAILIENVIIVISFIKIMRQLRKQNPSSFFTKRNKYAVSITVTVSISFIVSYFPIGLVLAFYIRNITFIRVALMMVWVDSFVNPLIAIFDVYSLFRKVQKSVRRKFHSKKRHTISYNATENIDTTVVSHNKTFKEDCEIKSLSIVN